MTTTIPPPIVAIISGLLIWIISIFDPLGVFELPFGLQTWVSICLVLIGIGIMFAGVLTFRKSDTTINPLKPEQASSLVVSGIYRITRNPMYLGMVLILSGWAIFLGSALAFIPVPLFVVFMNKFQIGPEEQALGKFFGQEFSDYLQQVSRWV